MKINSRSKAILDGIAEELAAHGITEFNVERRTKHGVVMFLVGDVKKSVFFSITPSDRRAAKNQRSDVRKSIREARM